MGVRSPPSAPHSTHGIFQINAIIWVHAPLVARGMDRPDVWCSAWRHTPGRPWWHRGIRGAPDQGSSWGRRHSFRAVDRLPKPGGCVAAANGLVAQVPKVRPQSGGMPPPGRAAHGILPTACTHAGSTVPANHGDHRRPTAGGGTAGSPAPVAACHPRDPTPPHRTHMAKPGWVDD